MNPVTEQLATLDMRLPTATHAEQLEILIAEVNILLDHTISPNEEWYRDRLAYVGTYRALDWDAMIRCENTFLRHTTIQLLAHMTAILMQAEIAIFSLHDYQYVLYNVKNVWTHYRKLYPPAPSVELLARTMKHLRV